MQFNPFNMKPPQKSKQVDNCKSLEMPKNVLLLLTEDVFVN